MRSILNKWRNLPVVFKWTAAGLALGLSLGVLYSVGGFFIDLGVTLGLLTSKETPGLSSGTLMAFGALIGMPIIFGIVGFIFGSLHTIANRLFQLKTR